MYNTDNKNIGVIVEQGFVAGQGLGYNPVNINNNSDDDKKEAE